ncbi:MAG: dTDP-4-dehydrorhamnose reductase [Thermodesulfovibrionales bacterium]|nr:dTDP-4-dehydrorhamnose reductase [Thermodesulfovibrionales bacterium]
MRFLITGAKGQLAGEFLRTLQNDKHEITALNKEKLDVSVLSTVLEAVSHYRPDVVINCAAYNFVDKAEEDFDTAFKINALGPKNLASACKKHNVLLIHYSTDYVFDGKKEDFYTEQDEPNPINKYGKSKLEGERFLIEETDNFLLFRVSWVFGEGKQNFLYKLKQWAEKQKVIRVVYDQISIPTYTEDIVRFTIRSIDEGLRGVYHLANSGYASRCEVARYFSEKIGLDRLILPVSSDYFNAPGLGGQTAKRPFFSAMSNAKLSGELKIDIPHWKDAVNRFIKRQPFNRHSHESGNPVNLKGSGFLPSQE